MTGTTSLYPVHLIDVVHLADGSRVVIRPTLSQDTDLQRTFFRALSAEARYCRFMTRLRELPDALVQRFTNIDHHRHLALLAEVFDAAGHESMIAEARYVMDEHDPTTCEFALAVADEWRSRGIARELLARLERQAVASGIRKMTAATLITNRAMRGLAIRAGYAISPCREDAGLSRLEKVLAGPVGTAVGTDTGSTKFLLS